MKILDRYILKDFSRVLILIMVLFIMLFIIIDFFDRLRLFLSNHATVSQMTGFILFQIPMIISLTLPVAVLIATLITLSTFARNSEITAMKANGISLYRAALPIFLSSLIISIGLFFFSEWATPLANQKADHIRHVEIEKETGLGSFKLEQLWYHGRDSIYNFNHYDPKRNMILGVSLYYLTPDFQPRMQIFSDKAFWEQGRWVGQRVLVITISKEGMPAIVKYDRMVMPIEELPADFEAVQVSPDKMGYFTLRSYIQKLGSEGADTVPYLVDLYAKIAFAFVTLLLTVIGVIFSVHDERSGGMAKSIGIGIAIGFSYWIAHAFFVSLGRSGTLYPLLAAWMANILFIMLGLILSRRIRT